MLNTTHGSGWIIQFQPTPMRDIETEYHPRQWVDRSYPAYPPAAVDAEYHRRQSVDRSYPAYERKPL